MQLRQLPQVTLQQIPDGPPGINQTLRVMRQFTRDGKRQYPIRDLALSLVRRNKPKDWFGEVRDLHHYVRDKIRYVRDINGIETLATPENTLKIGQGDCDDKSILLATLLESIGHPSRFVALSFEPGIYSHVLVESKIGDKWVSLETTEPVETGWYPPGVMNRMEMFN